MSDSLFLSLWFPGFEPEEMMPRAVAVMQQFPYSETEPGITYAYAQPYSWSEATVMERRFEPGVPPHEATYEMFAYAQEDFAVVFEAWWDLWVPGDDGQWLQKAQRVQFIVQGKQFDEAGFTESGHIKVDLGLDYPFLFEERELTPETEQHVKANIAKLVKFTQDLEKHCNLTGRTLWSEGDDTLAKKLIARLQITH